MVFRNTLNQSQFSRFVQVPPVRKSLTRIADYQHPMTSVERPNDEIANVLTHGLGFLLSIAAAGYLMNRVASQSAPVVCACGLYSVTLMMMYASSTLSHLFYDVAWRRRFRTLDQSCIFLLIAATYTPFAVMYAAPNGWPWLLICMWAMACLGIGRVLQVRDLSRSDKVLYGVMGFLPAVGLGELSRQAPMTVIAAILAGGACYSFGAVFLRISAIVRYSHAAWHMMVVAGSACHYWAILLAVSDRSSN